MIYVYDFCLDPQQRCSVAQIVHHDYLTKGVLGDETAIKPKKLMNPFALHMESPVLLPQSRGGRRKDDGDEVWARRQFSVLWAPMPADYDMGDESMHLVDNKRGSSCNSDVWLSSHRYEFTTIPEAVEDKGSVFFVK